MKIALVSDLHGNMTAVKALEKDLDSRQVDSIWCLGDVVGKGPNSHLTFDWAVRNCAFILRGNWDEGIGLRQFRRDVFYYEQLGRLGWRRFSPFRWKSGSGSPAAGSRLVHGRPAMDKAVLHPGPQGNPASLIGPETDLLIYGDCHRQGLRTLSSQVANIGSVGNALGIPMVQYALLEGEPGEEKATLHSVLCHHPI